MKTHACMSVGLLTSMKCVNERALMRACMQTNLYKSDFVTMNGYDHAGASLYVFRPAHFDEMCKQESPTSSCLLKAHHPHCGRPAIK